MKKLIVVFSMFLMFFSCDDIIFDEDSDKLNVLSEAIKDYQSGDYESAKERFTEVLNSGTVARRDSIFMGLGYSETKLHNFDLANVALDSALALNPLMTEALYGKMVLSYSFYEEYDLAISYGSKIVELDSNYVFKYTSTSNIKDVYLHLALSEYQNKEYLKSYDYTKKISSRVIDTGARSFTSDLASHLSDLSNELKGN